MGDLAVSGRHHGIVVNVLDCDIVVGEFKLRSRDCIHFRTNTLRKGMNPHRNQLLIKKCHNCPSTTSDFGIK